MTQAFPSRITKTLTPPWSFFTAYLLVLMKLQGLHHGPVHRNFQERCRSGVEGPVHEKEKERCKEYGSG